MTLDKESIRRAIRERNAAHNSVLRASRELKAAENSLARADRELNDLIPDGSVVLHFPTGMNPENAILWAYWHSEVGFGPTYSAGRLLEFLDESNGVSTILVEAPRPTEEFLPRLEQ